MPLEVLPILALVFLFLSAATTACIVSMQRLGKQTAESMAGQLKGPPRYIFRKKRRDHLALSLRFLKGLFLLAFASALFADLGIHWIIILGAFVSSLLLDFLFQIVALLRPKMAFRGSAYFVATSLLLLWPITYPIFRALKFFQPPPERPSTFRMRDKILEILHDSEFAPYFDPNDQKLLLAVLSFKERIAREVMVPRIDLFTFSAKTTLKEAAAQFFEEEYSRVPVFKESVDNIVGVVYYKDVIHHYEKSDGDEKALTASIEPLIKPALFAPETKKISHLLQEFKAKQIHLAIVVDEYGGTEGIVTIEDILEELVGEIADEYDFDEEVLYTKLPSGGWVVDAKMTIIDIEEELQITLPQSPEYDTLGGYIFSIAGAIPTKGWRLHNDDYDLEVLSTNERAIEKIRLTPHESPLD